MVCVRRLEGENIKRLSVGGALRDFRRDVIAGIEDAAATLNCKDLQAQVGGLGLAGKFHPFQEFLIIGNANTASVCQTERIYAVKGYICPPHLVGSCDNRIEESLFVFAGCIQYLVP